MSFLTYPYPTGLKEDLLKLCVEGTVEELCINNVLLGEIFATAAKAVITQAGKTMTDVALVGSHG